MFCINLCPFMSMAERNVLLHLYYQFISNQFKCDNQYLLTLFLLKSNLHNIGFCQINWKVPISIYKKRHGALFTDKFVKGNYVR